MLQGTGNSYHAFTLAVESGDLEQVNRSLEDSEVVANIADDGNQALRSAASKGYIEVINRLLEFSSVVADVAAYENLALAWAAGGDGETGHILVVNRLLEFSAVVNDIAIDDNGALRAAASNGNLEIVNRLLEFEAVEKEITAIEQDGDGLNPLMAAAKYGHFHVVDRLLDFKAVIDDIPADNYAALTIPAKKAIKAGDKQNLYIAIVHRLFAEMNHQDIKAAIAQHKFLKPLFDSFIEKSNNLMFRMSCGLHFLGKKGLPKDIEAFIFTDMARELYGSKTKVFLLKAKETAVKYLEPHVQEPNCKKVKCHR